MRVIQPKEITWAITTKCNMNCKHCSFKNNSHLMNKELSWFEIKKIIDNIIQLKPESVRITGGEPFMRRDLFDIISELKSNSIDISIISNGLAINDSRITNIQKFKINEISISLDGIEKIHDKIRKKGTFKIVLQNIKNSIINGISVNVITTLNKYNFRYIKKMKKVLTENGVKNWKLQIASPLGNFKNESKKLLCRKNIEKLYLFLQENQYNRDLSILLSCSLRFVIYQYLKDLKDQLQLPNLDILKIWNGCMRGKQNFSIIENGCVIGCAGVRHAGKIEGNAINDPLLDIWKNVNSFKEFQNDPPACYCAAFLK
jgi:MoaA/NifB/PqqE/SkfB family radical SAM enzyme